MGDAYFDRVYWVGGRLPRDLTCHFDTLWSLFIHAVAKRAAKIGFCTGQGPVKREMFVFMEHQGFNATFFWYFFSFFPLVSSFYFLLLLTLFHSFLYFFPALVRKKRGMVWISWSGLFGTALFPCIFFFSSTLAICCLLLEFGDFFRFLCLIFKNFSSFSCGY